MSRRSLGGNFELSGLAPDTSARSISSTKAAARRHAGICADGKPSTVVLKPCGQATARLVDPRESRMSPSDPWIRWSSRRAMSQVRFRAARAGQSGGRCRCRRQYRSRELLANGPEDRSARPDHAAGFDSRGDLSLLPIPKMAGWSLLKEFSVTRASSSTWARSRSISVIARNRSGPFMQDSFDEQPRATDRCPIRLVGLPADRRGALESPTRRPLAPPGRLRRSLGPLQRDLADGPQAAVERIAPRGPEPAAPTDFEAMARIDRRRRHRLGQCRAIESLVDLSHARSRPIGSASV